MSSAPDVVTRYLAAADARDFEALAACFTAEGEAIDEGRTYTGHDEIVAWRESVASAFVYTSTAIGSEPISDDEYVVTVHLEGNFPGGVVDLKQRFTLQDGLISVLEIHE